MGFLFVCVCVCLGTMTDESMFDSWQGQEDSAFLHSVQARSGACPGLYLNATPGLFIPVVKQPKHEAGHLFPHVIEVKNRGSYNLLGLLLLLEQLSSAVLHYVELHIWRVEWQIWEPAEPDGLLSQHLLRVNEESYGYRIQDSVSAPLHCHARKLAFMFMMDRPWDLHF